MINNINWNQVAQWYFILGICTCLIGGFRAWKGKTEDPADMDVWGWFLMWPVYLPIFSFRYIKAKLKGKSI